MGKLQNLKNNPYWLLLIFLLAAWVAVESPLAYVKHQEKIFPWQLWMDVFISCIFAIDLFAHHGHQKHHGQQVPYFLPGHEGKEGPSRLWIPLDVAACVPFDVLFWALTIPQGPFLGSLGLIKLVRVFKVYSVFTGVEILPRWVRTTTILASIGIVIHWIACAWMGLGSPAEKVDFATQYNMALYWTVSTLTTIGYGDITPTTNVGRLFTILVMFLGVGLYGLVISNVSKITLSSFRHKEKMREKIHDLVLLMRHYGVPKKVQREVFAYYQNLSRQRPIDGDHQILKELPHNLRQEMEIYMTLNLISNIPLFESLSSFELKRVASCLKQEFYSPGEMIISKGEVGDKMFIISNGAVDLLNEKREITKTLKSGQFFGEVTLMMDDIRQGCHVQAKSYCDIYTLCKTHFIELTKKYPVLAKNIGRLAIKRQDTVQTASPKGKHYQKAS